MRKFSIFISLFLVSAILYSQAVPELMYFRFKNNGAGTVHNYASAPVGLLDPPVTGSLVVGTGGQFDSCLVGNGPAALANLSGVNTGWNSVIPANWTISFWIGAGMVDGNPSYLCGDVGASAFRVYYGGAAGVNNILCRGGSGDVLITGIQPNATVVTIVYNGSNTTVYKDGVLFNTFAVTFATTVGTGFRVGSYNTAFVSHMVGKLDEFRFYNRALTASEITATWNQELPLSSPLCEQFAAGVIPPAGWTEVFTGTNYWEAATVSGFGVGTGSARWDCWNGATGTRQTLFTPTFTSTNPAGIDTLRVDVAYQPFGTSQDSLIIAKSSDGGATYTSLARLGPTQLGSTTGATSPFTPTASQWKKMKFVLPGNTNKLQIQGYSGFGDCLYVDSICIQYIPVGIGNNNNSTPKVYSLNQNFPNPFNPSTQISFGLPKSGNVKLVVFDILGREVKTLVNDFQTAGTHSITFDASSLSSGVYFYTITASDFTATKKMLLVK